MDQKHCTCGHTHEAHEHYRRGTDCGICGADVCAKFRPDPTVAPVRPIRENVDAPPAPSPGA